MIDEFRERRYAIRKALFDAMTPERLQTLANNLAEMASNPKGGRENIQMLREWLNWIRRHK